MLRSAGGPSFSARPGLGLENRYYGQSPLVVDLDGDGRNDFVWLNIDGPLRAFRNTSQGSDP